jgi:hypothetical protein
MWQVCTALSLKQLGKGISLTAQKQKHLHSHGASLKARRCDRRTPVSSYPSHLDGMDNCNRLNSSWDWSRLARLQIPTGNSPRSYTIHGLQDHNDAPRSWSRCVSFIFKDVVLKIHNTPDASRFSIDTELCKAVACASTRQSSGLEKASQDCESDLFLFLGTCFRFAKDKGCSLSTLCSSQQSSLTRSLNPR